MDPTGLISQTTTAFRGVSQQRSRTSTDDMELPKETVSNPYFAQWSVTMSFGYDIKTSEEEDWIEPGIADVDGAGGITVNKGYSTPIPLYKKRGASATVDSTPTNMQQSKSDRYCISCYRVLLGVTVSEKGKDLTWLTAGAAAGVDVLADFIPGVKAAKPIVTEITKALGKWAFKTIGNALIAEQLKPSTPTSFTMAMWMTVCADGMNSTGVFGMPAPRTVGTRRDLYREEDMEPVLNGPDVPKEGATPYGYHSYSKDISNWYHSSIPPGTKSGATGSGWESWD